MTTALKKPRKRGLMATVLGRMASGECLINEQYANSMLVGLLGEAEKVTDPEEAWSEVRGELCASWGFDDGPDGPQKPFIYQDGVAVIPVHGILLNRFNWCWGFVTGYDFIRKQKNLALADDDVKLIVYDHDTPGGEAAGCDELAREIYAERSTKPSMALINTLSCSGGYWLAAPTSRIICAPSGSVGSIGVYIQHMMIAKLLADWGIENEFIKRGEFKTSGNMYEPLSKKDRAYLQSMVDERYEEFVAAVAEFRGIEESVARDTEARVMRPAEALSLGLIDAAESPATAVASFVAELGNDEPSVVEDNQEDAMAEITSEDRAAVAKETQARIKGIMTHEEAKGREALAEHLAYETDNTVEQAVAMLKVAPKAEAAPAAKVEDDDKSKAEGDDAKDKKKSEGDEGDDKGDKAKGKSQFEQAMDGDKHPNVGPNGKGNGERSEDEEREDRVNSILGAQAKATGRKFDPKA